MKTIINITLWCYLLDEVSYRGKLVRQSSSEVIESIVNGVLRPGQVELGYWRLRHRLEGRLRAYK